jgi:hypothetical protein
MCVCVNSSTYTSRGRKKFKVNIFHKYIFIYRGIPNHHSWFATKVWICSYCEVWKCFCTLDYSLSVCIILDADVSDIDVVLCQLGARKVSWLMRCDTIVLVT